MTRVTVKLSINDNAIKLDNLVAAVMQLFKDYFWFIILLSDLFGFQLIDHHMRKEHFFTFGKYIPSKPKMFNVTDYYWKQTGFFEVSN